MGRLRRFLTPDPGVTLNPVDLGLRWSGWIDRQRWPLNYAYTLTSVLLLALIAIGAAAVTAPHDVTLWLVGISLGGLVAGAQAIWRLRVYGGLLLLNVGEVRTEQRKNVASLSHPILRIAVGLAFVLPVIVAHSRGLSALFAGFGGFVLGGIAVRAIPLYRHRAELKALTTQLQTVRKTDRR